MDAFCQPPCMGEWCTGAVPAFHPGCRPGAALSCIFKGVVWMHCRHQKQGRGLGNVITDFPESVMVLKTTRRVCIKANHYGKTFVAIFKNWERVSEYNTVKGHRSRRLHTSFLQNKCMFDDHRAVCGKETQAGALVDDFWILKEKEKCNFVEV